MGMWLLVNIGLARESCLLSSHLFGAGRVNCGTRSVADYGKCSSFQNTDLDYQLHQREITHVVLAGLTTNHCVEATGRYAYDLGYETTFL